MTKETYSNEEIKELLRKVKNGDKKAREVVTKYNLRLVKYVIKRFFSNSTDLNRIYRESDYVSAGYLGLVYAMNYYDVDSDYYFSTYAVKCIKNSILKFILDNEEKINIVSLETPLNVENIVDESGLTLNDVLPSSDNVINIVEQNEEYEAVNESFKILSDIEKRIIQLRYGFIDNEPLSCTEVSKVLGVSREYVNAVELKARKKILRYISLYKNIYNIEEPIKLFNDNVVINIFTKLLVSGLTKISFSKSTNISVSDINYLYENRLPYIDPDLYVKVKNYFEEHKDYRKNK